MPDAGVSRRDGRGTGLGGRVWRWLVLGARSDAKWAAIALLWAVSLLLGYCGFAEYRRATGQPTTVWHTLYLSFQLFTLESGSVGEPQAVPWTLEVARLLAPAVMAYTVFQAVVAIFAEQFELLRLWRARDHVVVCGLGRKGLLLTRGFSARGDFVVVIESDEGNDLVEQCREAGAIVLLGDATDADLLRKARVQRARHLFAVCGEDGTNAEIAVRAEELVRDRERGVLECYAHIVNLELCTLLREKEIYTRRGDAFRLEFFNVYESGAAALLRACPPFEGAAGEPHLLVVGLGRMGQSLVMRVAYDWYERHREDGARLRLTVVDREVDARLASLRLRHPQLDRACDIVAHSLEVQTPEFQRADFLFDEGGRCTVTRAYLCLDADSASLAAALIMHRRLRATGRDIPITVRVYEGTGLARLLAGQDAGGREFGNVQAFLLLEETCSPEQVLSGIHDVLARAIHEDYVRSELAKGEELGSRPSLVLWDDLSEGYREANRHQAAHLTERLEALGYRIVPLTDWDAARFEFPTDDVERMAELEHERWCAERRRAGWRYGSPRDNGRKLHPNLVPWDKLSEEDKEKDRVMVRGLPAFLAKVGFQVERRPDAG